MSYPMKQMLHALGRMELKALWPHYQSALERVVTNAYWFCFELKAPLSLDDIARYPYSDWHHVAAIRYNARGGFAIVRKDGKAYAQPWREGHWVTYARPGDPVVNIEGGLYDVLTIVFRSGMVEKHAYCNNTGWV